VPALATSPSVAARPAAVAPLSTRRARIAGLCGALGAVALGVVGSLCLGSLAIPLREVIDAFVAYDGSDAHAIVRDLRVPRTELGLLVGAALGAAGALMQGTTRNPLAEPGLLGVNAGAAFAVVVAIRFLGVTSVAAYAAFALAGAAAASVLVFVLGASGRGGPTPVRLALAGAVLTALLVSLTSAVLVFDARTLDEFRFWIVGSIAGRDASVTVAVLPLIAVGLVIALTAGRSLNALALGDDVAKSLGQNVTRARLASGVGFVLLAGAAVAAAGPVAFVGLAVPHIARALVGADYRWLVPYSVLLGAAMLLGADVLGRVIARPAELQVGIVTAIAGAPFLIAIARRPRLVAL
jgi:iron complex transport system permease protein